MKGLNKLAKEIYDGNKTRGFDVVECNTGQTLMLIVSELVEALEADRKLKYADLRRYESDLKQMNEYDDENLYKKIAFEEYIKDTFEDEIADTIIRVLDLCGGFDIDIERHIELKLRYNATREYKHGKAY